MIMGFGIMTMKNVIGPFSITAFNKCPHHTVSYDIAGVCVSRKE
jgi:hypothetical protein